MTNAEVVPFGKYKGQPAEVLLADREYCDWLGAQPWFRDRYPAVYQVIVNYGGEPQDSPEHNQMQVSFLDDSRCVRLARLLWPAIVERYGLYDLEGKEREFPADAVVEWRTFESGGWDVAFTAGSPYQTSAHVGVELKPDLGDDFPAVLRQVRNYPTGDNWPRRQRCVVVRRHRFEQVTWDQVVAMFEASGVVLLHEADLEDTPCPG